MGRQITVCDGSLTKAYNYVGCADFCKKSLLERYENYEVPDKFEKCRSYVKK